MNTILILTAIGLFLLYVAVLSAIGGIKTDITHLYYTLPEKLRWITTAVYLVCAGILFYVAVEDGIKYLLALSSVAFAIVGLNPDVRKGNAKLHVIAAILAIVLGVLSSIIELHSWYLGTAFLLFMLAIKKQVITMKHLTFWTELFAFLVVSISAIIGKRK